jgi:hypothetical protein
MSHLSPAELVDAAEGALTPSRAAHIEACAACRDEAARLAGALAAARGVDVPEPSPLYWTHLSARIREGVANERMAPAWRAGWRETFSVRRLAATGSVVALAAAVAISGLVTRNGRVSGPLPPAPAAASALADPAAPADESEAWQMLTSAAAETPIEDAHAAGMAVPAGAIDRAVQHMSADELSALGELLQRELRRSGD